MTALQTTPSTSTDASGVVVKCVGLTKLFRDFWLRNRVRAVDGLDLDVRRGEVFGLLGPNGSGKSTTIKMILGLLQPTAGHIIVLGKRPEDVASKRLIGYLPEESYLYRFLNARETLDYYARLFHLPRHQRRMRVEQLIEQVGLSAMQRRPVGEYSKGMQRRIGLAQALINDPELLILDEPTSGLDPLGARDIKDLIVTLKKRGKTVVLCSHLLSDVEDVCDRAAIMYGGKLRALGTIDELLSQTDSMTLQTPVLDVQTITEIEALLESKGLAIDAVERPRAKLENLFIQIVHQARAEGVATSGATSGGKMAAFLSEGAEKGNEVLEQLTSKAAPAERPLAVSRPSSLPEDAKPQAIPKPAAPKAQEGDRAVLDQLTGAQKPHSRRPVDPFEAPPTADELELVNKLAAARWAQTESARKPPEQPKAPSASGATPASAGGESATSNGGEKADSSYLDALLKMKSLSDNDDLLANKPPPDLSKPGGGQGA